MAKFPFIHTDRVVSGLRRRFGISAPKLSVKTAWSWKVKGTIIGAIFLALGALVYGGFDAGQLFAGINIPKLREQNETLSAAVNKLTAENETLRKDNIDKSNAAQIATGTQDGLNKQLQTLQAENTQLKEDVAYFEKLAIGNAGSGKNGLAVQRLQGDRIGKDSFRIRGLIVQGSTAAAFKGRVSISVNVDAGGKRTTINLPEDQSDLAASLALDFKTYQRLDLTFKVPAGGNVKSISVRVLSQGSSTPKAQQILQL